MVLLKLFFSIFYVNLFTIGGGYVMLPLLQKEVVERHHWLTNKEFMDAIAAGQVTPGPFTIMNAFIGYKVSGISGAFVATAATYLPSVIIVSIVCKYYFKFKSVKEVGAAFIGLRAAVVGLLAAIVIKLGGASLVDISTVAIAVGSFAFITFTKIDPTFIILGSAVLGTISL